MIEPVLVLAGAAALIGGHHLRALRRSPGGRHRLDDQPAHHGWDDEQLAELPRVRNNA